MFQRLLKKISRELGRASIPYMVIGGQAVLLYGEPRLTKDIDVTLGIGVDELGKVKSVITRLNLKLLVEDVENFVGKTIVRLGYLFVGSLMLSCVFHTERNKPFLSATNVLIKNDVTFKEAFQANQEY